MSEVRIRNVATAFILTLAACTSGSQQRLEHAEAPAASPQKPVAGLPSDAAEEPSAAVAAPAHAQAQPAAEKPEPPEAGLPTECHKQGDLCLPAAGVVDRLCRAAHLSTALRLFAKSSPFTRGYVRMREVRAANLRGGPVGEADLRFAEEVLILAQHGGSGEIQVSGTGGFDVLRWDGTCATLSDEELVLSRVPAPPRHAQFAWKYIDDGIQQALLQNAAIKSARADERKRCRGLSSSQASASCRQATERLNEHIVLAIRTGMDLPLAEYTP